MHIIKENGEITLQITKMATRKKLRMIMHINIGAA